MLAGQVLRAEVRACLPDLVLDATSRAAISRSISTSRCGGSTAATVVERSRGAWTASRRIRITPSASPSTSGSNAAATFVSFSRA